MALSDQGRYTEATQSYARALALDPTDVATQQRLAEVTRRLTNWEDRTQALEAFAAAVHCCTTWEVFHAPAASLRTTVRRMLEAHAEWSLARIAGASEQPT